MAQAEGIGDKLLQKATVVKPTTAASQTGVGDKLIQAAKNVLGTQSTSTSKRTADSILPSADLYSSQGINSNVYYTGAEAFGDAWNKTNTSPVLPSETKVYTTGSSVTGTGANAGTGADTGASTGAGADITTQNNYSYTGGAGSAAKKTAAKTGTGNVSPYTLQSYQAQEDQINSLYDAQREAQLLALENAYNLSREEAEYAASRLPETYQQQANQVDTRAMQARQNFNEWAAGQGLNVGAGSQAALAMSNQRNSDIAAINRAQADAQAEAQRNLATMQQQYQNAVAEAISQNQYDRAAALLKEYQTAAKSAVDTSNAQAQLDYQAKVNYANTLAKAGDYSGYKALGYTNADIAKLKSATKKSGGGSLSSGTPNRGYTYDELVQAAAEGMTGSMIATSLQDRGVQITDAVRNDIQRATGGA